MAEYQDKATQLELKKKALLQKMLIEKQQRKAKLNAPITALKSYDQVIPASDEQMRLLVMAEFGNAANAFNMPVLYRIEGALDTESLEKALNRLVARHSILRTSFEKRAGQWVQTISSKVEINLSQRSVDSLSDVQALAQHDAEQAFQLNNAPLIRSMVFRSSEQTWWYFNIHHSIFDGWSNALFMQELQACYTAEIQGEALSLSPLELQYADYAVWQNESIQREAQQEKLTFWKQALEGVPALELPLDFQRPAEQTFEGKRFEQRLSEQAIRGAELLAQTYHCSPFLVYLTVYQLVLGRFCGQNDFAVGTSMANRSRSQLANVMGFFTNLIALRARLDWQQSFSALLLENQKHYSSVMANQDVSFHKVVEALQPERDASRPPIFQANIVFQNSHLGVQNSETQDNQEGLCLVPEDFAEDVAQYELSVHIMPEVATLSWLFNSKLLSTKTVERIAELFEHQLVQVSKAPEQALQQLQALPNCQSDALLAINNQACSTASTSIPAMFDVVKKKYSSKIAFYDLVKTFTYDELDKKTNQLANELIACGVTANSPVGLCLPRGGDWVIGMLAILKAGGCYVPLDATMPAERLDHIIDETGMFALVTNDEALDEISAFSMQFLQQINLDEFEDDETLQFAPPIYISSEQAAYIMYTSGSTGVPKGVVISHQSVLELVNDSNYVEHSALLHTAQLANPVFDAMTFEVWAPLLHGGQITFCDKMTILSPEQLTRRLVETGVNTIFITTALFNQLVRGESSLFDHLDTVLFGGEACDKHVVQRYLDRAPKARLLHVYGPTEATTFSTWHHVKEVSNTVPIGQGLAGTAIYIVDDNMNLVPQGSVGELCLSGQSLAHGYLQQPSLTAEHFVPNPFITLSMDHSRLYKTGDLVRLNRYAQIEYVTRRDNQIKIRGHRIELGEIAHNVRNLSAIDDCFLVVDKQADNAPLRLYYTGIATPAIELQRLLKLSLPEYMVPQAYCHVEHLPLNRNGKIDIKALPRITDAHLPVQGDESRPPQGEKEIILHQAFLETLKRDRIGVHDSFFDLGGDSVVAIGLKSAVQEKGFSFELETLFKLKTIAQLAPMLSENTARAEIAPFSLLSDQEAHKLKQIDGIQDAYPLSNLQQSMVFHGEYDHENDIYHEIVIYQFKLAFQESALRDTFDTLCKRHDILRTGFVFEFEQPIQCVYEEAQVPVEVESIKHLDELQQLHYIQDWEQREKNNLFNWQAAPLMRVKVFLLSEERWVLAYSCHHAIWDGWSESVLTSELLELYQSKLNGEMTEFDNKTVRFNAFIAAEQAAKRSPAHKAFWQKSLEVPTWRTLPIDPANQQLSDTTKTQFIEIGDLQQSFSDLAKQAGVSLKAVFLALHFKALSEITGSQDVLSGVVSNGRPETAGGDRCIGLFLNTLPLRCQLSDGSWLELLKQIHKVEQQAFEYRLYPLTEIMRDLQLSGAPFDVAFNFTHFRIYEQTQQQNDIIEGRGGHGITSIPLTINASINAGEINFSLTYHPTMLNESQILEYAQIYENVARTMTANPSAVHHTSSAIPESSRACFNGENTQMPELFFDSFDRVVQRLPDNVALHEGENIIRYSELATLVDSLTYSLSNNGVSQGSKVAVVLPKGANAIISYLAIMRLGAAYIPVDLYYGDARIVQVCQLAEVDFIIYDQASWCMLDSCRMLEQQFNSGEFTQLISDGKGYVHKGLNSIFPQQTAYIIFTSGSTGVPKGVEVSHQALANYINWHCDEFSVTKHDCSSLLAGPSFDASCHEIWPYLATGAKIAVLPALQSLDEQTLLKEMLRYEVTCSYLPTVWVQRLTKLESWREVKGLRIVMTGGDKLNHIEHDANWQLFNAYGLTESTIVATCQAMSKLEPEPTIGRAIHNTSVYVLNDRLQPSMPMVEGELYISGQCLALGYLNQPALTAERFLPDPFAKDSGARMFKTGDLVRADQIGTLNYRGRIDTQVQIRGHRVELSEIEVLLEQLPWIKQVAVIQDKSRKGLLAFFTIKNASIETLPSDGELRRYLGQWLPVYMLPESFIVLDVMPVTANGKLDLKQLQNCEKPTKDQKELILSDSQYELLLIWQQVLSHKGLTIDDNFFAVGGDSLKAVQLIALLKQQWKKPVDVQRVTIKTLYENPTVREFVQYLAQQEAQMTVNQSLVRFNCAALGKALPPVFCVPGAGGQSEIFAELAKCLSLEYQLIGLQYPGLTGEEPLREDFYDVVAYWASAIRQVQPKGPYRLLGHSMGCAFSHAIAHYLEQFGDSVEGVVLLDGQALTPQQQLLDELKDGESTIEHINEKYEVAVLRSQLSFSYQPSIAIQAPIYFAYSKSYPEESLRQLVWTNASTTLCEVEAVSGDHQSMLQGVNCRQIAKLVRQVF